MKTSQEGLDLIKRYEGIKRKPYKCPAGLWTVGVGHLIGDGHSLPDSWNRTLEAAEVDALLAKDVARFERGVARYISAKLTQGMFDALVSFSFNLGLGTLQRSTLRQKINRGDKDGAIQSLLKYNKAGGKVLKGLDLRRKAEAALFLRNNNERN
jgi:lysozyme